MAEVKFEALSRPQKLRDSAEKIVSNLLLGIPANTIIALLAYLIVEKKFKNSSTSKNDFSAVQFWPGPLIKPKYRIPSYNVRTTDFWQKNRKYL